MMSYALPESMMAIDITRHGGPEVLQAIEMPLPKVQGEYLLVKVAAAGVNRPDVFQRQGSYPPPPDASPIRDWKSRVTLWLSGKTANAARSVIKCVRWLRAEDMRNIAWFMTVSRCRWKT